MLFLENEAQIDRNNYGTMLFMSKQVSLPKISLILQKMKIGQNSIYALFAPSPSIVMSTRTGSVKGSLNCQSNLSALSQVDRKQLPEAALAK